MTIAKLLLYTYVAIEGVFGVGVSIWACVLLADPNQPAAFSLGVLGAGLLMLFCAVTFYKGMTGTPCLLNLSFLASLLMAVVFSVTGIVLWQVSDQVCEEAEEMLKKNGESCKLAQISLGCVVSYDLTSRVGNSQWTTSRMWTSRRWRTRCSRPSPR